MKYRPEIDGLRALAVVPVILFHAGFDFISGGFLGVDVFFVISGFLITSIILSELEAGSFSLGRFYERRARRILPALFVVIFACLPFAWAWMMSLEFEEFAKSILYTLGFASNILFYQSSGYFDTAAEMKPLLHTWSLAVEEQYYIFIPLLLMGLWRFGRKAILASFVLLFVGSLAAAQYYSVNDPMAAFYMLPMRGWELLIGGFGALYMRRQKASAGTGVSLGLANLLSAVGLGMVIFSMFAFHEDMALPSLYSLVPTVGTALILLFARDGTFVQRVLSLKGFVGIGLISYSAYLWHQPLIAFTKYRSALEPSALMMAGLCLVVLPLSYLTWRFVEQPFRSKQAINGRRVAALLGAAFVMILVPTIIIKEDNGLREGRFKRDHMVAVDDLLRPNQGIKGCGSSTLGTSKCVSGVQPKVALWGDSHAAHLVQALENSKSSFSFKMLSTSSCHPILGFSFVGGKRQSKKAQACIEHNQRAFDWIAANEDIEYVVMSSPFSLSWATLYDGERSFDYSFEYVLDRFIATLQALQALGKKVVLVTPPPNNGQNLGGCFVKSVLFGQALERCNFTPDDYSVVTRDAYELLKAVQAYVPVIWLDSFICPNGVCNVSIEGEPVYYDNAHLSITGSDALGRRYDLAGMIMHRASEFYAADNMIATGE